MKICFILVMFILPPLLPAGPACCGTLSSDHDPITVPPGGYAWSVCSEEEVLGDFKVVPAIAPGPWPSLRAVLPQAADSAVGISGEWLRNDLRVAFSNLLYRDLHLDGPAVPGFVDVNFDGNDDLVVLAPDGSLQGIYTFPGLEEADPESWTGEFGVFRDVTGDGIPDSVSLTDDGVLIIYSEGRPVVSSTGFDVPAVSGIALLDMECDGLADLVLGTESGCVLVYRNFGTDRMPCFVPFQSRTCRAFPMNPGAFSSPAVLQVDDSILVLAVGTQKNGLHLYRATVSEGYPLVDWSDVSGGVGAEGILNISPTAVELADGPILVCGSREGILYGNIPGSDSLFLPQLPPVPGSYPDLAVTMVDDDEFPDLVAGTMEGQVYYLEGWEGWFHGSWMELEGLPQIPSGAPSPWSDGLVFGMEGGGMRFYTRNGSGSWVDSTESSPFRDIDVGDFSVPEFVDLDGDGVTELVAGSSRGDLTLFELCPDASDAGPLYLERFSWEFQPGGAVPDIESYYSRYFQSCTVIRVPTGRDMVEAFAGEILKAPQEHRDEVAYCVAHTPTEVLTSMYENGDTDLLGLNARSLYQTADQLDYVTVEDSGGISWCRLRTLDGWFDVDPEDYYRFVVHPRILFEVPARVNSGYWSVPVDSTVLSLEDWLNQEPDDLYGSTADHVFWRAFLPVDSTAGSPLLESMTEASTYEEAVVRICNFQSHSQPEGMMSFGYATNDLQPMVIYSKAYGSCGEQSILQTALCRTFLIPAYVVGCRGEDHQWAHYLHPASGKWQHWDINYGLAGIGDIWVSGEGIDHQGKTISTITAFGPDNSVWPMTLSAVASQGSGYMPGDSGYTHTARVEVRVLDPSGMPVEGAMVLARSHWENANSVSQFEYTDLSGACEFMLGWEPGGGYTMDVVSPFGSAGSTNISFREDTDYHVCFTVPCLVPRPQSVEVRQSASFNDSSITDRIYPVSYFSGSLYSIGDWGEDIASTRGFTSWRPVPGSGTVLYMNCENFRRYRNGLHCRALGYPFDPAPGDTCYAVLDNRNSMFTWREFHMNWLKPPASAGQLSPPDEAWLEGPFGSRLPLSPFRPSAPELGNAISGTGWIVTMNDLQIRQDDPGDPLSSGQVVGPFSIPQGARSLSIETMGDAPGMDVDLYLFRDSDGDLAVDGMDEMILSSTTPASSEKIVMTATDTSAVYWIYVQGWQVPGDSGKVDLGLSFSPEMIRIHSLHPTGPVRDLPDLFSFRLAADSMDTGDVLLATGGDTLVPRRSGDRWEIESSSLTGAFMTGEVEVLAYDLEHLGSFSWNVMLDSVPPVVVSTGITVDSRAMEAGMEVRCLDSLSGIRSVTVSTDSLPESQCRLADSVWSCSIDLALLPEGSAGVTISLEDSAGNSSLEHLTIDVPERPGVIFRHIYPEGVVYDHRPVLQFLADFGEVPLQWTSSAVLSCTSGSLRRDLSPFVQEGPLVQFLPPERLPDGDYSVTVSVFDEDGSLIGEGSWDFQVRTMVSTK
jgi:hypothetical protein